MLKVRNRKNEEILERVEILGAITTLRQATGHQKDEPIHRLRQIP